MDAQANMCKGSFFCAQNHTLRAITYSEEFELNWKQAHIYINLNVDNVHVADSEKPRPNSGTNLDVFR